MYGNDLRFSQGRALRHRPNGSALGTSTGPISYVPRRDVGSRYVRRPCSPLRNRGSSARNTVLPRRCSMGTEASVRRDRLVARMTAMAGRRFSTLGGSTARSRASRGERNTYASAPTASMTRPAPRASSGGQLAPRPTPRSTSPTTKAPQPRRVTTASGGRLWGPGPPGRPGSRSLPASVPVFPSRGAGLPDGPGWGPPSTALRQG